MFHRAELKKRSKEAMQGNWPQILLTAGLMIILYGSLAIVSSRSEGYNIGDYLSILFDGPVMISFIAFMLHLHRQGTVTMNEFYMPFSNFTKLMLAGLWQYLWIILWTLLLIIPGVIKFFSYSQYYFILADNPDANFRKALKTSIKMTNGYKSELFVTYLSFINWVLVILAIYVVLFVFLPESLATIVCSIVVAIICLYLVPYIAGTYVGIYEYLKEQAISNGVCDPAEFGLEEQQQNGVVTMNDTSITNYNQLEIHSAQTFIEQAETVVDQEMVENVDEPVIKVSLENKKFE